MNPIIKKSDTRLFCLYCKLKFFFITVNHILGFSTRTKNSATQRKLLNQPTTIFFIPKISVFLTMTGAKKDNSKNNNNNRLLNLQQRQKRRWYGIGVVCVGGLMDCTVCNLAKICNCDIRFFGHCPRRKPSRTEHNFDNTITTKHKSSVSML